MNSALSVPPKVRVSPKFLEDICNKAKIGFYRSSTSGLSYSAYTLEAKPKDGHSYVHIFRIEDRDDLGVKVFIDNEPMEDMNVVDLSIMQNKIANKVLDNLRPKVYFVFLMMIRVSFAFSGYRVAGVSYPDDYSYIIGGGGAEGGTEGPP